ncbi:protein lethal(2)essential for life [Halyomorpha halys]|uniref:protein lethal(2)essential for life n=1 Tax=Halyomorpha halys TaxID=286706 RepID=UPI0006D4D1BC|nr:alpha-crystallin A chain [Halyomorpha halys]
MSLIPFLSELIDEYSRPRREPLYDQNFGIGLLTDEILRPMNALMSMPLRCGYLRPWRNLAASDSGISSIQINENEFVINLDVQQFKPEELKVKVSDGYVIIDGKHEERSDEHGFVSRQFTRRYKIPENVDESALCSNLSSDGVLTLKTPKKDVAQAQGRDIPITQTNEPAAKPKGTDKIQQSG